tara:strand:+ start:18215 stop:18781 length:567 start_codon:yes stop_codon:yes gene_type:complete
MKKIAIFGSGNGSNAKNIINYFKLDKQIIIKLIVTNRSGAGIIKIAKNSKIETLLVTKYKTESQILSQLKKENISFIVLAGYLKKIPELIINNFQKKIINIHPSLLPNYGGKGMYGLNVHQEVLNNKETETGITIHYVNEKYDEGKVILQAKCNISNCKTAKLISNKVQKLEHQFYPIIIEKILKNGN